MKSLNLRFATGIALFSAGILSALFSQILHRDVFLWLTLFISMIYLFAGWYFFRAYHPEGNIFVLILTGYLYSSLFLAYTVNGFGLPLTKVFLIMALFWSLALILLILLLRKKLPKKGLISYSFEAVCLFLFTLYILIRAI